MHEDTWQLDNDQVKSALKVLTQFDGIDIEIISLPVEDGISTIAFGFKNILDDYGVEIQEIAMDSTCKFLNYIKMALIADSPQGKQMQSDMNFMLSLRKQTGRHSPSHSRLRHRLMERRLKELNNACFRASSNTSANDARISLLHTPIKISVKSM